MREFVKELNGRYQKWVSDEFLEHLLVHLIVDNYRKTLERRGTEPEITALVYSATVGVFEGVLEDHCRTGGNGHHVAQDLASKFV